MIEVENYHFNYINTTVPLLVITVLVQALTQTSNYFVDFTACMFSPSMALFPLAVYKHTRVTGRSFL